MPNVVVNKIYNNTKADENKYDFKKALTIVVVTIITTTLLVILWEENILDDFYHWGPPFKVGNIVIETWFKWWLYVTLLICYQVVHVYIEETIGRDVERRHMKKHEWTNFELIFLSCHNFYRWLGTILHIVVAVTRLDIWLIIALVDTTTRIFMWKKYDTDGRRPRFFTM